MYNLNEITRIDRILIAGSFLVLLIVAFIFVQGMTSEKNNSELFSFKSGSVILIDENLNFRSPERVEAKNNLVINLKKGIYYWKIEDAIPVEDVVQLEIKDTTASLKLVKANEGYNVINSGASTLNVDIYASGKFTGRVILGEASDGPISGMVTLGGEDE